MDHAHMSNQPFMGGEGQYIIAEISFDETQVRGAGGTTYPRLVLRGKLAINPTPQPLTDYVFTELSAQLHIKAEHERFADSLPFQLYRVQRGSWPYGADEQIELEFPLDARRVNLLEQKRNGGAMDLRLSLVLSAQQHAPIEGEEKSNRPQLWGLRWRHRCTAEVSLTIPATVWIQRVLPQIGYGVVHVIELPAVSVEACKELERSYAALCQAQERHAIGQYDDAVGKCRVALDSFFEPPGETDMHSTTRRLPNLEKGWEDRLGKVTYDWLNGAFKAIRKEANPTHHWPNASFSQFDSQMIIAITTTVVAYAARTLNLQEKD